MIDYLAIIGDSSDNIPGVKWVGPKGAIWLIQKYHTLENIYDHIDEISASLKEKLIASKEIALQGKSLVQLMEVPTLVNTPREEFATKINFSHFRDILINQYQFTSMEKNIKELQDMYEKPQQTSLFG
jgi:DNA polymerase-1